MKIRTDLPQMLGTMLSVQVYGIINRQLNSVIHYLLIFLL